MRKAILSALFGVAMMLGSSDKASACHKTCVTYTCYPCYYTCDWVYPTYYNTYRVWHVYQTNPVTGAAEIVQRYFTKEGADANPLVAGKKAYVVEYLYYAA